jgi:hypothetical protein
LPTDFAGHKVSETEIDSGAAPAESLRRLRRDPQHPDAVTTADRSANSSLATRLPYNRLI